MAKLKLYLDTRTTRPDGRAQIKIAVNHKGSSSYIPLGIYVEPGEWNADTGKITKGGNKAALNAMIGRRISEMEMTLFELSEHGNVKKLSASQLRDLLIRSVNEESQSHMGAFVERFRKFIEAKEKPSTREIYEYTLSKLYKYCPQLDTLAFEDINRDWLQGFDKFLAGTSPSRNARNIHLRNIRAVFNDAIDDEVTQYYPFRKFKIRPEATAKRSLPVEQLRTLFGYPVEPHQRQYLDMFKLIFCLIGINIIDLCNLKPSDYADGRITYRRAKTGRLYDIKVEPEAAELIRRHSGNGWLVDILDRYDNYRDYAHRLNENLRRIGEVRIVGQGGKKVREPICPQITTYWARHTWATVAASLDIPKETISEALGHEIGSRITSIYIDFDRRKVDEANRRVLDWVLYGKR